MKDPAEQFCGGRTCPNICRGLAKFLFASSQKCDSPFRGSCEVWIFHEVEWGNETGEQCSPLQIYCRGGGVFQSFFYSIFKLQTRCRKCFSVRSEPLIVFTLLTLTECFLIHCYLAGYSIWDNILILIPKITAFVA